MYLAIDSYNTFSHDECLIRYCDCDGTVRRFLRIIRKH
jgi:hypothetical protein